MYLALPCSCPLRQGPCRRIHVGGTPITAPPIGDQTATSHSTDPESKLSSAPFSPVLARPRPFATPPILSVHTHIPRFIQFFSVFPLGDANCLAFFASLVRAREEGKKQSETPPGAAPIVPTRIALAQLPGHARRRAKASHFPARSYLDGTTLPRRPRRPRRGTTGLLARFLIPSIPHPHPHRRPCSHTCSQPPFRWKRQREQAVPSRNVRLVSLLIAFFSSFLFPSSSDRSLIDSSALSGPN